MPYRSEKQRKWAHTPAGTKALGGPGKVREWDRATRKRRIRRKVIGAKSDD